MLIGAISDLHFHNYKKYLVTETIFESFGKVLQTFQERGVEVVCVCGDVFHVRGYIRPSIYNRVYDILSKYDDMQYIFIYGNHDMENAESDEQTTSIYTLVKSLKKGILLDKDVVDINGVIIGGLGYRKDINQFKKDLSEMPEMNICLIHQGIDDFAGNANIPETGLTTQWLLQNYPRTLFLAGHYHNCNNQGNVRQIGSLTQQSFADVNSEKYALLINYGDMITFEYIKTQEKLLFHDFAIDTLNDLKGISKNIDLHNCYVRVFLKDAKLVDKVKGYFLERGVVEVEIIATKEYTSSKKAIKIDDLTTMVIEYINSTGKYLGIQDELINTLVEL